MPGKVYLSGRIYGLTYAQATGWRDAVASALWHSGIEVYDPMRGKEELAAVEEMPHELDNPTFSKPAMFTRDLLDITRSDIVLVYNIPPVGRGTMFEMGYAYAHNIPIVLVTEPREDESPFMECPPAVTYTSLTQAVDFIISVLED